MTLSHKLLLLLLRWIYLSPSTHRINGLGESLSIRLGLLFVSGTILVVHTCQVLCRHRLSEITITIVVLIIIKSLVFIILIVYIFGNFIGIIIN